MTASKRQSSIKYQVRETVRPTVAPLTTAIGGVLAAGTLQAATITVTTLQDGFVNGECSLRSAIYAATTNQPQDACSAGDSGSYDVIEFAPGLNGTLSLQTGSGLYYDGSTLAIGEDVRIYGDHRIAISGTGNAPVFYGKYQSDGFQALGIWLDGLTITGGGGDYGAGILARNKQLTIADSVITGNNAAASGGAIWHQFEGVGSAGTLVVADSVISGNQALSTSGGGGAIFGGSAVQSIRLLRTTMYDNVSLGSGGAVELDAQTFGYVNSFSSTFENNLAKYGNGGAININVDRPPGQNASSRMLVRYSDFVGNEASQNGGAIALFDTGSTLTSENMLSTVASTFDGNEAGSSGGAVWIDRGDGSSTPGDPNHLIEFIAGPDSGEPSSFINNTAQSAGGAVYISAGDRVPVSFEQVSFSSNRVIEGNGGGAHISLGDGDMSFSKVTFGFNRTNTQSSDSLIGRGGGLVAALGGGDFYASELDFFNNTATSFGGARIAAAGGTVGIEYSQFLNNRGLGGPTGALSIAGPGSVGLRNTIFRLNESTLTTGGLSIGPSNMTNVPIEIKYSEFSNNNGSDGSSGAINVVAGSGSTLFLKNSTISGNQAGGGPALTAVGDMELEVKYSTVAENHATISGGGLYSNLANGCRISNSILAGNTVGLDEQPQDLSAGSYECDVRHSLVSGKYSDFNDVTGNVLYVDPRMDPLSDNGGNGGRTHALRADSPAVDAGNATGTAPSTDQRGSPFVRIFGSEVDMGAYERQDFPDAIFSDRFESP